MRRPVAVVVAAAALVYSGVAARAAGDYPRTVVAQAKATTSGATSVTSTVTIKIDRLMEESRRTRVLDGLKYNGYQGFMNALRPLPVIGSIATPAKQVQVRYAWETKADDRQRLVVVSDKPLFFLAADEAKARAGYELTVIELFLDARGTGTGTMAGAARVKPAPDGIVLDDFAASPVQLTVGAPPK
jgi:hypothetical protein